MFVYSVEDNQPVLTAVGEPVDFAGPYRLSGEALLGNAEGCQIRVRDARLNGRQARFVVSEAAPAPTTSRFSLNLRPKLNLGAPAGPPVVHLQDLGGGCGVYVNGKKIERVLLEAGDEIRFGAEAAKFAVAEPPQPAKSEPPKPVEPPAPGPTNVEISRETVPWQPVASLADMCTDDKGKWVSSTLKLDAGGQGDKAQVRLQVLLSASAALSRPQKLEDHLAQVADFVLQTMNLDRAALFLLRTPWNKGEPIVWRQRTQRTRTQDSPAEPSMTVMSKVVQDEEGVLIRDAMVNDGLVASQSIKIQKIRTCICVPLKTPRGLLGVLYADAGRPSVLNDKEDIQFFSAFATMAAVAVENSLLLQQVQQEAVTRARFERFFPPNTVETVLGDGEDRLAGREQDVTVMFCDIRNYTQMSADRNPREVAELLNRYFQTLVPIVFRNAGTLEKYIGDALVAIWGAPLRTSATHQAVLCSQAALEIQRAIAHLNERFPEIPVEVGIGIHHGPAYVGTIGDDTYMQYAAIGATTNLSARICGKTPAREVLVSRRVADLIHEAQRSPGPDLPSPLPRLQVSERGQFLAKGFADEVEIFQVSSP